MLPSPTSARSDSANATWARPAFNPRVTVRTSGESAATPRAHDSSPGMSGDAASS